MNKNLNLNIANKILVFSVLIGLLGCGHAEKNFKVESGQSSSFNYKMKSMSIDGLSMKYVDIGKGQPIVLIHGNPTSSYLWRNLIPHFSKEYRVIVPDLLGMGKSDTINVKAEDLLPFQIKSFEEFIVRLKLENVIYVGQDWGGLLAANQSTKANAARLVLFEAVKKDMSDEFGIKSIFWGTWLAEFFTRDRFVEDGEAMNWFQKFTSRTLAREEISQYRAPFDNDKSRLKITYDWYSNICVGDTPETSCRILKDVLSRAENTDIPKLLIWANQGSLISSLSSAEKFASDYKNMLVKHVGDGKHYLQEDHPKKISALILNWIKENEH
jgi:haloalkane dehalogenase